MLDTDLVDHSQCHVKMRRGKVSTKEKINIVNNISLIILTFQASFLTPNLSNLTF